MQPRCPAQRLGPRVNRRTRSCTRRQRLALAVAGLACLSTAALGQSQHSYTFAGSGLWTDASNWLGGAPDGNDNVFLSAGGGSFEISSIPTYSGWRLTSEAGAGSYTLSGGTMSFFDFGSTSGTGPKLENLSSNLLTFNTAVVLDSDVDSGQAGEINPVNGDMIFNSTVDLADSGNTQLRIFGNNGRTVTFNGVISGPNSVAINQASNVVYNAANTYTGETFVNAGTLQLGAGGSVASALIRVGDTTGTAAATLSLVSPTGGQTISTPINVRSGSTGVKTIKSTNTSGTNTLSGNIFLDADVTVSSDNAGGQLTLSGTTIDLKNQTMTITGSGNTLVSGTLQNSAGSGKLIKSGSGVATLSAVNSYGGATTINGGVLSIAADSGLGTAPVSAVANHLTINGGTLRTTATTSIPTNRGVTVGASGGTLEVASSTTLTVNSVIAGSNGFTKAGGGTLILGVDSTATGNRLVTGGTLSIASSTRIPSSGTVTLDGGALVQTNTSSGVSFIPSGTALDIGVNGGTVSYAAGAGSSSIYAGTIRGMGNTLYKSGVGEFRYQGTGLPNTEFAKLVVLDGLYRLGFASSTSDERGFGAAPGSFLADAITLNGGSIGTSFNVTLSANRGITLGINGGTINASSGAMVIPGKVTDGTGAGSLTLFGTSVTHLLTLSNPTNEIAAGILIRGGRLIAGATGATGTGNITIDLGTNGGGLSNNVATLVEVNNPLITLGGTGNPPDIGATSGNTLQINSKITGARPFQKTSNTGTGTLTLTNSANDFTGNVTLSSGQIAVTANNALGTAAGSINVQASTSLVFRGNVNYTTAEPVFITGTGTTPSPGAVNSPSGGNLFGGPITLTGTSSVNVDAGSTLTLTGALATQSSSYFFSKSGGGTLALQGDSSGFNATGFNINGGTLSLTNTSGSATGSTPIIVKTGATLSGTGSTTAAVSIDANATLSPGLSIGDLDTGSLTFADSTSKYLVEINADTPAVDRTLVTGGVVLNGATLQLSFVTITPGVHATLQTFVLIDNDAADLVSGTFGGVTAPPWASVLLNYAYSGTDSTGYSGDGNDVAITITYTPEPSTMVGVVGLAGLLARRRRR